MDTEQIRNLEQIRAWVATRRQPVPRLLTQTSYESTALHHIDDLLAAIDELTATNREKEMRLNQLELELADRRDAKQARVNELEATVHVVEDNAFEYEMRAAYAEEQVAAQRDRIDKMAAQIVVEKTAAGLWATEAGKRGRVINELTAELKALQSWAVPSPTEEIMVENDPHDDGSVLAQGYCGQCEKPTNSLPCPWCEPDLGEVGL